MPFVLERKFSWLTQRLTGWNRKSFRYNGWSGRLARRVNCFRALLNDWRLPPPEP